MTDLSGRVDTLETNAAFMSQDLLQKISLTTLSEYSIIWNNQLNAIDNTLAVVSGQLGTLQTLYTNLYVLYQSLYNTFTGHTGNTDIHV